MKFQVLLLFLLLFLCAFPSEVGAHVGSPDVFLEGKAGPYQLNIVIRPPDVVPGVAQVEVRSEAPGVRGIKATPLPMTGPAAEHPPAPETLTVSPQDAQFFTGGVWMMSSGSWQIRVIVDGDQGQGVLSVPVSSVARTTKRMHLDMVLGLSAFGLFLIAGAIAIAGASVREAQLTPGARPQPRQVQRGRFAMLITFLVVAGALWGGYRWWNSEADDYDKIIYKPLRMVPMLQGNLLKLKISDPGWFKQRKIDDLIVDHEHLMHLYAIRRPGMDAVYHLHPERVAPGAFELKLPSIPEGKYDFYADIVHQSGFPETMVASLELPAITGRPPTGDDAGTLTLPVSAASDANTYLLPDGYRMVWERPSELKAKAPIEFRFKLFNRRGKPASDLALYMGMLGHAAFVKTDGTVYAHVHPSGSAPMAAMKLAQGPSPIMCGLPGDANEVVFPYGFPSLGAYRIIVQMKHESTVETGVFDATVSE
jgi:hypothetical protein